MTWVKVCGLTTHEGVAAAFDAGTDAVGFVNIASSPRYVTLERAAGLAQGVLQDQVDRQGQVAADAMTIGLQRGLDLPAHPGIGRPFGEDTCLRRRRRGGAVLPGP